MLFPPADLEALVHAASEGGPSRLSVPTVVDPVDFVRAASRLFADAYLVVEPSGEVLAGVGSVWRGVSAGVDRFARIQAAMADRDVDPGDRLFAGFAFSAEGPSSQEWEGFHGVDAVLPKVSIVMEDGQARLEVARAAYAELGQIVAILERLESPGGTLPYDPGGRLVESRPPSTEWLIEVDEALEAIDQGNIEKVVLSRSVVIKSEVAADAFELADQLRAAYPQCYVFVWQAGDVAFVGASPELLLSKRGNAVRVNPLAGSAPRGEGEKEDRALGESLLNSAKDLREHALVVDDLAARLGAVLTDLVVDQKPELRQMATVQHLSSDITGSAADGTSPLDLIGVVQPTPAVGGTPRLAALAFLDKIEGIERGWYSGGIGWISAYGDATFAIPLRCALIRGTTSYLYAGAGIVSDSVADDELAETRLKFRPLLNLLTPT